jgi:cysteine desulfurase/selenocysteine lyase
MPDWSLVRAQFPATERYTYLNTAGAPPLSRRAAQGAQQYYAEMLADGDVPWPDWLARVEAIRGRVARLLGAEPDEIAFTYSSSHAFNLIAGLLGAPAHVVAMADEFPSATLPWMQYGDRVAFVASGEAGEIRAEDIESAVTPQTRAVVTSSVLYRTGFRQNLARIGAFCRRRGVRFVVDASQSMGAFPLEVRSCGVDALAFSGYKWTMAGYGIGAMYVARDTLCAARMPMAGWFSARDPEAVINDRLDLKDTAAALEVGCPHFAGIFALGAALELLEEIGQPAIEQRIHQLTDRLHAGLDAAGFDIASPRDRARRAGITIVRMENPALVVEALARERIIVSARGAGVRVSVHIYNNEADVDRFVDGLREVKGPA